MLSHVILLELNASRVFPRCQREGVRNSEQATVRSSLLLLHSLHSQRAFICQVQSLKLSVKISCKPPIIEAIEEFYVGPTVLRTDPVVSCHMVYLDAVWW